MHRRRLRKLAAFLESDYIKPKWFNMDVWATDGFKEKKCGTAACALGWATVIFRDLTLNKYDTPIYQGASDFEAGEKFFEISEEEAGYIFSSDSYRNPRRISPKAAAKHIRKLLAGTI